jgi:galactokinase/mevalonate kinase-like predicted kinase
VSAFEATAPTRIDLTGSPLEAWPIYLFHAGALRIDVALDRRVSCRVTTGVNGVTLESKDAVAKIEGRDVSELLARSALPAPCALVANVLRALGVEAGLHVVTQARVPWGSGLGVSPALAVAVTAATAQAVGRTLSPDETLDVARDAETQSGGVPTSVQDYQAALRGGVLETDLKPGRIVARRLAADPSGIEEHLLLVDSGTATQAGAGSWDAVRRQLEGDAEATEALGRIARVTQRLRAALLDQRHTDAPALIREEWAARKQLSPAVTAPAVDRIVELAVAAGGAAKACGAGGGGMVAVWIAPDARSGLTSSLAQAGFKAVPIRLDLQGVAVEKA